MQGKYFNEERQTTKARSKWKENKNQNNSESEWKEGGLTAHLHHKETRRVLKATFRARIVQFLHQFCDFDKIRL